MNIKLKKVTFTLITFFSMSFAKGAEIPNYSEILAQQIKCNPTYFKSSIWNKKLTLLENLNSNTMVVISKPTVMEVPAKVNQNALPANKRTKEKTFKVSSNFYNMLNCDSNHANNPTRASGSKVETFVSIIESKPGAGTYNIVGDEVADHPEADAKINFDFLYNGWSGDGGLYCVVLVEDFVKDASSIDLDKLCKGQSAKNREATKVKIEKIRKELIAKGVK
jgi:hypothetical protein